MFILSKFCKEYNVPLVRAISSDSICYNSYQTKFKVGSKYNNFRTTLKKFLSDFAMYETTKLVTQTYTQKKLIEENFGLKSIVIPNGINLNHQDYSKLPNTVSWLGNMRVQKRPEEFFIELAEILESRDVNFLLAGSLPSDPARRKNILSRVKKIKKFNLSRGTRTIRSVKISVRL